MWAFVFLLCAPGFISFLFYLGGEGTGAVQLACPNACLLFPFFARPPQPLPSGSSFFLFWCFGMVGFDHNVSPSPFFCCFRWYLTLLFLVFHAGVGTSFPRGDFIAVPFLIFVYTFFFFPPLLGRFRFEFSSFFTSSLPFLSPPTCLRTLLFLFLRNCFFFPLSLRVFVCLASSFFSPEPSMR